MSRRTPSSRARRRAPARRRRCGAARPRARARARPRGPRHSPAPRPEPGLVGLGADGAVAPHEQPQRVVQGSRALWRGPARCPASAAHVSRFGAARRRPIQGVERLAPGAERGRRAPRCTSPGFGAVVRRLLAALAVDGADRAVDGRGLHLVEQPRRLGRLARRGWHLSNNVDVTTSSRTPLARISSTKPIAELGRPALRQHSSTAAQVRSFGATPASRIFLNTAAPTRSPVFACANIQWCTRRRSAAGAAPRGRRARSRRRPRRARARSSSRRRSASLGRSARRHAVATFV